MLFFRSLSLIFLAYCISVPWKILGTILLLYGILKHSSVCFMMLDFVHFLPASDSMYFNCLDSFVSWQYNYLWDILALQLHSVYSTYLCSLYQQLHQQTHECSNIRINWKSELYSHSLLSKLKYTLLLCSLRVVPHSGARLGWIPASCCTDLWDTCLWLLWAPLLGNKDRFVLLWDESFMGYKCSDAPILLWQVVLVPFITQSSDAAQCKKFIWRAVYALCFRGFHACQSTYQHDSSWWQLLLLLWDNSTNYGWL